MPLQTVRKSEWVASIVFVASAATSFLATGCAFVAPSFALESVPVPIGQGGQLEKIDLKLYVCTVLQPTINFPKRELHGEHILGLVGALPGGNWKQQPGIPLRMKIEFVRRADAASSVPVVWRSVDSTSETIESWGNEEIGRIFESVTLPAGHYYVVATLVDGAPALSALHPSFELWSSFKLTPTSDKCTAPAFQ